MTDRERWIVYPLLFLALGMAWRDKVVPDRVVRAERVECEELVVGQGTRAARIECNELFVVDRDDRPQVTLRSSEVGGIVNAVGADGTIKSPAWLSLKPRDPGSEKPRGKQ